MARIFSFERELLATLDLVPLTVRRKLDLARLKLSLAGWQALALAERRALTDAEVDDDASVAAVAAALRAAAGRAGAALRELDSPGAPPWRTPGVPAALRARLGEIGASLGDEAWAGLDDDGRYALLHLAARGTEEAGERLRAALVELGVGPSRV